MKGAILEVRHGDRAIGAVYVVGDHPKIPAKNRGRIKAATGCLTFWCDWHVRTFLKLYRSLGCYTIHRTDQVL